MKNSQNKEFQVFFIVSHHSALEDIIKYEISKENKEISDLSEIYFTKINNKDDIEFKVRVLSFTFNESYENDMGEEIKLIGYGDNKFLGKINFMPKKNNFIYDFSFDICHKDDTDISPPESLKLTKYQQYNIFDVLLKQDQFKKDEFLQESLLNDSFFFLKDFQDYYHVDFYLSLLVNCYLKKNIIELLSYFNLKKIKLSKIREKNIFSNVLNKMKISPELITKHLNEDESEIKKYLEIFYTLLLYYRQNYEPEKINELFEENKLNQYYRIILFSNEEHFNNIYLPISFIDQILQTDFDMNYKNLLLILKYLKRFDRILLFLNKHSNIIIDTLENKENDNKEKEEEEGQEQGEEEEEEKGEKEKNDKINLIELIKIKEDDDIKLISHEMNNLLEKETILNHIDIGQEFWEEYSEFFNKKDLIILINLEKIIMNIKKKRNDLIENCDFIYKFIHYTGLDMSINHKFKDNIELLKFIKDKDIYYTSKLYHLERDINIFLGIDFSKKTDDEFFQIWESLNFNEMFEEEKYINFQELIVSLIDTISSFPILFKLFDYTNTKIFTESTLLLFKKKYISLIGKNVVDDLNLFNDEFIEDSALLLYLLDKKLKIAKNYVQNELSKILPTKLVNEIFLKSISKFKDLSDEISEEITDFFTKKENLKCGNLIYIMKNLENIKYKKLILNKISKSMIIEKKMLFYERERDELLIFIEFQKMDIFNDKNYELSPYVRGMISACNKILDYIRNNKVTYNELEKMKLFNFKKELKAKIEILNIEKTFKDNEIDEMVDKLAKNKDKIKNQISLLEKYHYIDTTFFNSSKHQEIIELENLLNKIKTGSIEEINKNQKKFEEYSKMYPEDYIKDKILLSTSLFFTSIFDYLKKKYQNSEGVQNIFQESYEEFKTLVYLFEKIPNPKIKEEIFEVCLKAARKNDKRLKPEMHLIQIYFNIDYETNFEKIADSLKLFCKKNEMINIINGISDFLKKKKAKITTYYENLMVIKKNLSSKNINTQKIYEYLKELSKDDINIIDISRNNNDYLYIFVDFFTKPEAFDFLLSLNEEDCRNFQEIIDISDNNFLISSDIQDLEKCRKFLYDIRTDDNNPLTDKQMLQKFIENAKENKNISLIFNRYFSNYSLIKELRTQKFEKIETNKEKSKNISKNSLFTISIINDLNKDITEIRGNNFVSFIGSYKSFDQQNNQSLSKNISFLELKELRELTMLSKENEKDINEIRSEEETSGYIKKFNENIKEIINIFTLLEKISQKGYHEKITIIISIKNNESFYKYKGLFSNEKYEKCKNLLNEMLLNIMDAQITAYKSNELIRFIYGRQFSFIYNSIKEKNFIKIEPILNYIMNDSYKIPIKEYNFKELPNEKDENDEIKSNEYKNIINNCNNFVIDILKLNNKSIKDIYQQNIIHSNYNFKGLYNYLSIDTGIEEQILSWYYLLTKNYPMAKTLLLCDKDTSSDEIISFIYRAILCPYNALFMMGRIEELSSENCEVLIELISELYSNREREMNSCLVFIYKNNSSEIVRLIQKIHYCEPFKHNDKKKILEEDIFEGKDVEIYYSDSSGVGKSTKIKKMAEELGKNYVYFPLGGEFNKREVISRLKNNKILNEGKNIYLHIDLFDTEKTELMKEFLFSILITKLYKQNEYFFYLNNDVEIKIELPYGFIDFFLKFPFLKMFKNKILISIENLPSLIVPKEIDSDIQIICNYLKLFKNKQIIENDLYIPNISNKYFEDLSDKITATIISDIECRDLIYEYLKIDLPNYYQINNFIKILSGQFKKLSLIKSLSANLLKKLGDKLGKPEIHNNRYIIIDKIINNTRFFISSSFEKLLNSQNISYKTNLNIGGEYDEKKQNESAIEALSKQSDIISYNNIKTPLVFFYEGINPYFTIVSPYLPENEEYKNLIELDNLHSVLSEQKIRDSLKRYDLMKPEEFNSELKQILSLSNPINKNESNPNNLNNIKDIVGYYVITADNFLKMLLILLRIRENVPVIMMGETGCGKTSLIRKLYELMNDGEDNMKILNIHSGITNQEIVDFLFKKKEFYNNMSIIEEANELEKIEEITQKEYLKKGTIYNKRKIWVFLDEINTCNCLGLISELLCKHSCNGIPLPDNLVFIGACNPYRLSKIEDFDGLQIKHVKKNSSNLVYTVNPLPHCLLNYVLNFGSLSTEDEKKYINNIIKEPIEKFYLDVLENNNKNKSNSIFSFVKNLATNFISWSIGKKKVIKRNFDISDLSSQKQSECLCLTQAANKSVTFAQEFIRDIGDVSSTSLRELRRFSIFYVYFVNYLLKKKESENNEKYSYLWFKKLIYKDMNDFEVYKYSVILSIFICYYFRIKKKEDRNKFCEQMDKIFKDSFNLKFLDIPKREEKYIINNIIIPTGIAKNNALLNNLFVLFVCVTAKIPLFIVGKPGCSKSLSVQLLFKSMKGEDSDNILFKNLPKLICNSYQGSLTSTSQGILKIFQKARKVLKDMKDEDLNKVISMIYLDEMGLAENSPNNPLKVLHSELEYDLNDGRNKISFVGISNWKLDAAKMNRGIYLSIPDLDEEDLNSTSVTIAESYNKELTKINKDLFLDLAMTYYEYKNELKKYRDKQEFHGARDFYHLIKNAAKTLFNKYPQGNTDENIKQNIGIYSIERNLAGLKFDDHLKTTSLEKVKKIFQKKYINCEVSKKYDVLEKIKESINDLNTRYLLLITNSSITDYLIYYILNNENEVKNIIKNTSKMINLNNKTIYKEINFYIGSRFVQDQYSEEYSLKMINKIQVHMEKNSILILKDLETIYPSLYDLFNQNFTIVGDKNYARLSLGYSNNTYSLVNDEFKCIVIVNEKDIDNEEIPFLNRFEKHFIDFEYLLNYKEIELSERILNIFKNLQETKLSNGKKLDYDISKLLININKEEIQGIIYYLSKQEKRIEDIEDFILKKISMILPQDIILLMNYSENINKFKEEYNRIKSYYSEENHTNLISHLKSMEKYKNIIYTFSNILDPLFPIFENINNKNYDNYIETVLFGKIRKENIKIILINSFNSESELEYTFDNFFENKDEKIMIIKFNPDECEIMNYLKTFIKEKENNSDIRNKKAFIFIVYIKRIFNKMDSINIDKYTLSETITFLNEDYFQIFIDNLNGINLNINQLMKMNSKKDLMKACIVNLKKILFKNIYSIFSYFRYTFKFQINDEINKNNYSKYIVEYMTQNDYLNKKILEEVENINLNNEEDLIKELFVNNHIKLNNIDYISVISDYLINLIIDYLVQFIFKSEIKHIFSPFLSHRENIINKNKISVFNNKYISYTIDNAFRDVNNEQEVKFINQIGCNNLTILLGIKIPGIKPIIDNIISFINDKQKGDLNISEAYLENENEIRTVYEEENPIEYLREINSIKKRMENKELIVYNYIKSFPSFNKLIQDFEHESNDESKESIQFLNLFFDDYLLIYLSNNFNLSDTNTYSKALITNFIILIKKLLKKRFDYYDENIKIDELLINISRNILWIESNNKYIVLTLMIYQKLFFIELLNIKMEKIINNEIKYEYGTPRSPSETKIVNECFYLIIESMIKIILSENNLYNKIMKKNNNLNNFINIIKEIYQYASQLDYELNLFCKELSNIKSLIYIQEIFNELKIDNEENIKNLIDILINKNKFNKIYRDLDKKEIQNMINNIKDLYGFLNSKIGFHKNFSKLINNIFFEEYKRINEDNYRKSILEIILNNKEIIKDSTELFILIFNEILGNNSIEYINEGDEKINDYNIYFEIIESTLNNNLETNYIIEQILLKLFESYFITFFETIKNLEESELKVYYNNYNESKENGSTNDTFIMLDFSLKVLKTKLLILEKIYYYNSSKKNDSSIIDNEFRYMNISKLYSIAYIKLYLYKAIHFILTKKQEFMYFEDEVMGVINGESLNNFRKIIKIYIFKLLNIFLNNYQELQAFHYSTYGFKFIDEFNFKAQLNEKNNEILNYYILPINEKLIKYEDCLNDFNTIIENKFICSTENFEKYITEENIDIFYSFAANKILSNIDLNEQLYLKFSSFSKNLLNKYKSNIELVKLLSLLIDEHQFNSLIRPKIVLKNDESKLIIDYDIYKIILNSMRFCIQSIYNKKHNNLYFQLLNENCTQNINKFCLPGIDESNDIRIINYYLLEDHLNNKSSDYGAYMCSCGTYYNIPPCGFPIESYKCINCKQLIGGTTKNKEEKGYHKMIIRKDHFRIFKNKDDKIKEFSRFNDTDELIPNMLLEDYKNKYIDPLLKKKNYGIPNIDKITFIQKNKKIRNLSQVGYRLLNYILYSHLFFSYCLGYIKDDVKERYLCDNMTFTEILRLNWELLEDSLFNKGITIIQIFLNLIFDKISFLLKNCDEIILIEQRNKLEESIENILKDSYKEYEEYSKIYIDTNSKLHNINSESLKSIILELYNPEEYSENDYPFIKYFIATKYPTEEHFINELYKISNYKTIYPLITSYIDPNNSNINLLKELPKYNNFVNLMINKYSYKISRSEANTKKLNDEDIYKNNENNFRSKTLKDFLDAWNQTQKYNIQYKCHIMEEEYLTEKSPLSHFLIDDGEIGKGMYLAAGYTHFINLQNNFLEPITKALDNNKNGILYYYNKNLKNRIDVQNATENEIIKKEFPDNSNYINFLHLICLKNYRNIYYKTADSKDENKDKTILNYFNYNNFIYDFNSIEEELGKILLTGKRLFNNDKIKFVTYCYEGFRGEKSSILIDFIELYPQKELNQEEKNKLYDYVIEKNLNYTYDFTQFMFSVQLIIYYLTQDKKTIDSKVYDIILNVPEYLNISDECKKFFESFYKITVEKLFAVFSFIELFCFDIITKNLKDEYKINLKKEIIKKINDYFNNGEQKLIDKENLASACRKLISRYLISKRSDNDISPDNLLCLYLTKADLWNLEIIKNYNVFEFELDKIKSFDVKVKEAYNLCQILDPDNISMKELNLKIEEKKKKMKKEEKNANEGKKKIQKKRVKKF